MDVKYYAPAEIGELETFINSFREGHFNGMEDIYEYHHRDEIIISGHILQTYKYVHSKFMQAEAPAPAEQMEGVQVLDYSDKAVAVIGNTYPIKEQLKSMGGRFNRFLSCGAGWIFRKDKKDELILMFAK